MAKDNPAPNKMQRRYGQIMTDRSEDINPPRFRLMLQPCSGLVNIDGITTFGLRNSYAIALFSVRIILWKSTFRSIIAICLQWTPPLKRKVFPRA